MRGNFAEFSLSNDEIISGIREVVFDSSSTRLPRVLRNGNGDFKVIDRVLNSGFDSTER